MSTFPSLTGKKIVATLKKAGFVLERQRGSHIFLRHPDGRATVVPIHKGETIGPGLFAKILRDAEMAREDFIKIMEAKGLRSE